MTTDSSDMPAPSISISVEFTGGLEMLFDNRKSHQLSLPATDDAGWPVTAGFLVRYLCDHVMTDQRREFFVIDDAVRPGILVLINDADWELEGEEQYQLQSKDNIIFVSTLHGG